MLNPQPIVTQLCNFLNEHRSEYFTLQQIWEHMVTKGGPNILTSGVNRGELEKVMDRLLKYGLIKIMLHPPQSLGRDPRRPYTRAFARQMVKRNVGKLTNSAFEILQLDPLVSTIIKNLDGRHSMSDIVAEIQKEVRAGRLKIAVHGKSVGAEQRDQLTSIVNTTLEGLQRQRLIVC
ncbi:MAG: hypothetical protein ACRC2T_04085 [Thermoguttaceae bacterium]